MLASIVVLLLLLGLTARAVLGRSSATPPAQAGSGQHTTSPATTSPATTAPASTPAPTSSAPTSSTPTSSSAASSPSVSASISASGTASGTAAPHGSAAPLPCTPAQLQVQAVVGQQQYAIGDQPVLTLQVTNEGALPCTQDVADSQIELRVYNGASRVWGSHDCQIQPGVDVRTLLTGHPAGFSIVWSGLTSQPQCAGTRQRVGAGTYTLYAALSGHDGTAAQFTIS